MANVFQLACTEAVLGQKQQFTVFRVNVFATGATELCHVIREIRIFREGCALLQVGGKLLPECIQLLMVLFQLVDNFRQLQRLPVKQREQILFLVLVVVYCAGGKVIMMRVMAERASSSRPLSRRCGTSFSRVSQLASMRS